MTKAEIIEKLTSKKSADRRRAAKEIGNKKLSELGDVIYQAYLSEKEDPRTWETQTEMIKAMGAIGFNKIIGEIEPIVKQNKPHDMITLASAICYVQVKKKTIHDASPVIELLEFGSVSVITGALKALAIEQLMPSENEIRSYLKNKTISNLLTISP